LSEMILEFRHHSQYFKSRVHCFSMQVVMNKCFLNPEKKFVADPTCRFREKRKRTFNSEK